jgi:exopolysaccharide biosynthesis WecB/TagA/CpsF family protein
VSLSSQSNSFRRILGINFFTGTAVEAVERMEAGGLLVVPAAPALKDLPHDSSYREALLQADLVITDSSFMILLWNWLQRDHLVRVSGLAYLRELLLLDSVRKPGNTLWVMASENSARINSLWLQKQGHQLQDGQIYIAPAYEKPIEDSVLLERLQAYRPQHVIVTIGGGRQEQLGLFLKRDLDYEPAIHCVGAALAFLSGDQVRIPMWADRYYLGWFLRCLSNPRKFGSRYWKARHLTTLIFQYRDRLPDSVG